MEKIEKISCLMIPFFIGMVCVTIGIFITYKKPELLHGIIIMGAGFICMSLYCTNSILIKILETKK